MKFYTQSGETRSISVSDYYTYDALCSLIEKIRDHRLSNSGSPSKAPKHKTEASFQSLSYPLTFTMNSRGWMEGFKFEITDTKDRKVFEGESRDGQKILIARGDKLVAIVQPEIPGEHYFFKTPEGKKIGGVKKVDQSMLEVIHIYDGRGNQKGVVKREIGLHSITKHLFLFEVGNQAVLKLIFENKGFWLTYKIEKLADVPASTEQLCLYAAFALRLIEPEMVNDPLRSHLTTVQKILKGGL